MNEIKMMKMIMLIHRENIEIMAALVKPKYRPDIRREWSEAMAKVIGGEYDEELINEDSEDKG